MSSIAIGTRSRVLADLVPGTLVKDAALVLGGAALTGLAAQVVLPVPGSPVPFTGQTFAALVVGAALGWRRGGVSMLLYLVAGALGLPWFNGGTSGLSGASAGYIVGMVVGATLVGALAARGGDRTVGRTLATMAVGNVVIYAIGVSWLIGSTGFGVGHALAVGVLPFLIGDAVKIALAAGVLPGAWHLAGRSRRN